MAQSILIFDFGPNEEAAQQARHKVEAWTQGARLGKKILMKFEREEDAAEDGSARSLEAGEISVVRAGEPKGRKAPKSAAKKPPADAPGEKSKESPLVHRVRLLVRLDFSDHEKLTRQRWLARIAAEEPFKSAKSEAHRSSDPEFAQAAELFDSLD